MQLERFPDAGAVARRAADLVAVTLRARPDAVLLLPAGATPSALYAELVRRGRARALSLAAARLFQLDELVGVARDDARSFHAQLVRELVDPLGLGARFHGLDGAARDPAREIERHRRELAAHGPAELALLGLGLNGHVAFNEPGATLADAARVVALAPATRAGLHSFADERPTHGATLGLAEIHAARQLALLVTGASKAAVLRQVLADEPGGEELPAARLRAHPCFTVLADEAALGPARSPA